MLFKSLLLLIESTKKQLVSRLESFLKKTYDFNLKLPLIVILLQPRIGIGSALV